MRSSKTPQKYFLNTRPEKRSNNLERRQKAKSKKGGGSLPPRFFSFFVGRRKCALSERRTKGQARSQAVGKTRVESKSEIRP
jgi:hypothetical protein